MDNIAGHKSGLSWAVNISVVTLVLLWIFPTVGLFVSSFRTADQISATGWWKALFPTEQVVQLRTGDPEARVAEGDGFVLTGNLFGEEGGKISAFGVSSRDVGAFQPGETADMGDGESMTVEEDGSYIWRGTDDQISGRGQRVFVTYEGTTRDSARFRNAEILTVAHGQVAAVEVFFGWSLPHPAPGGGSLSS